jgi:hypothetical protein
MMRLDLQTRLSDSGLDTPIFFIRAHRNETVKAQALDAGAICFLYKHWTSKGLALPSVFTRHSADLLGCQVLKLRHAGTSNLRPNGAARAGIISLGRRPRPDAELKR